MLKVAESVAALNEQDCKTGKIFSAMKTKNGFANMPVTVPGVVGMNVPAKCSPSIVESLDSSNATVKSETEKTRNGQIDMSVYEYCRKIISSPSPQEIAEGLSSPESTQINFNSAVPDPTNSTLVVPEASTRKLGSIIRKRKPIVRDQTSSGSIKNEDTQQNEISTGPAESLKTDSKVGVGEFSVICKASTILPDPRQVKRSQTQNELEKKSNETGEIEQSKSSFVKNAGSNHKDSETVNLSTIIRGPKAKKTISNQSSLREEETRASSDKKNNDFEENDITLKLQSDGSGNAQKSTADIADQSPSSSSGGLAGMTIKVNVLENALGLSTKSFNQLDAKTFDRIVLSVFQHRGIGQARKSGIGARASAKFGSTSRHANRRIGSAFMSENLSSPQDSVARQQQDSVSPQHCSTSSSAKRNGFLAKKSSLPSLFSFKRREGSGSESVDNDSQLSAGLGSHVSSTRSNFVQKARKSSQLPWMVNKEVIGKDAGSDVSTDVNSQSNISENSNKERTDLIESTSNKIITDFMVDGDEKQCIKTRQSYKRKCSSTNLFDESRSSTKRRKSSFERQGISDGMQTRERRIRTSDFSVPMSRPSTRSHREADSHQLSVENESKNNEVSEASLLESTEISQPSEDASIAQIDDTKEMEVAFPRDPLCLCCCTLPGVKMTMMEKCQAIDSFDGKALGCSRKVTNFETLRPCPTRPFMALCEDHRRRMKEHQCCPGCGFFCAQGNFFECREEHREGGAAPTDTGYRLDASRTTSVIHRFHKQCQIFAADNRCYCPHCYAESAQFEGVVYNTSVRPATFLIPPVESKPAQEGSESVAASMRSGYARLSMSKRDVTKKSGSVCSDSLNSIQSCQSEDTRARNNLDFHSLLETFNVDSSKLKKVRPCSKTLCMACKTGDTSRVVYILAEGVDPSTPASDSIQPAIHLASKHGHHDIVDLLLSAGVSSDSIDQELHTPVMEASQAGCLSVVNLLIKAGCSVDARAHDGMTALHLAAKCGRREVLRVLLNTGKIDINIKDDGGWTALIWATEHGHKDCIGFLLSMGANPNIKDNELNTALHWAAFTGNEDAAAMFLDAGCFIDDVNDHGDTPLHIAARQDHFKCVDVLIVRSATTKTVNKAGFTALQCCPDEKCKSAHHIRFVSNLPQKQKEKVVARDISRGRESCPIMAVNPVGSDCGPPDFSYILGYVETSPINVNRLITSLQTCTCEDNCLSASSCGCCRSSVKRWYDENGRLSGDFNYLEPPLIFECNIMCSCRTSCLNRVVQLGTINNLQVFRTNGRGWGCRTLRDITKGTFVCEYAGELITDEEANRREDDSYLFDLDIQDSETYCIDAARYGNVSRFINHLCEPNVIPVKVFVDHQDLRFPRICFFASKDIKAFDELGFDYGYKFWSIKWKYFTCTCGSQNCKYSKDTILSTIEEYNKAHAEETDEH